MCATDLVVVMQLMWPLLAAIFELILHCSVFIVLILPLFALLWQLVTSTWWLCYFWDWWYMLKLIEWPMMHNIICWGGYLFFWLLLAFFLSCGVTVPMRHIHAQQQPLLPCADGRAWMWPWISWQPWPCSCIWFEFSLVFYLIVATNDTNIMTTTT
jgi:hypothetical protein